MKMFYFNSLTIICVATQIILFYRNSAKRTGQLVMFFNRFIAVRSARPVVVAEGHVLEFMTNRFRSELKNDRINAQLFVQIERV